MDPCSAVLCQGGLRTPPAGLAVGVAAGWDSALLAEASQLWLEAEPHLGAVAMENLELVNRFLSETRVVEITATTKDEL